MKQRYNVWYWILTALPVVAALVVFPFFPDSIPAHYNLRGEVDRWGSRGELLIVPVVYSLMAVLFYQVLRLVQKKGNKQNEKAVMVCGLAMLLLLNVINGVIIYQAYQGASGNASLPEVDTVRVISIVISLLFLALGNLLPKCKQNEVIGIRTKWTLESEEVWYRTHRLGGKVMVASGFVCLLLCAFWLEGLAALTAVILVLLLGTALECVYAYRLYQKLGKHARP